VVRYGGVIAANMLQQTDHSIDELIANDENSFTKIYEFLTPTAFPVLASMKEDMGDALLIVDEEGNEVEIRS
jgi:hypothetical protein